jgi:hypothetical protein
MRMKSSRTSSRSASGPRRIIAVSGRQTFATWSSLFAVSWISGDGCRIPIGSPGRYSYSHPQPQPCSEHAYPSPASRPAAEDDRADRLRRGDPAAHGPFPVFCGAMICDRR